MKTLWLALALSISLPQLGATAEPAAKSSRPAIYDRNADGGQQIAEALRTAKSQNKRVLLQFGANWCGWCHKLHTLFKENGDVARILKENYVVVLIDVDRVDGQTHNQAVVKRYDNPTRLGLPVIVVLNSDGKALTTQDTGKLEEGDHHDPKKVLAFLDRWKPQAAPAK